MIETLSIIKKRLKCNIHISFDILMTLYFIWSRKWWKLNCRPPAEPDTSSPRWLSCAPRPGSWPTSCSTTSSSPAPASGSPTPTWRPPARRTRWRSWSTVRRSTPRGTSPTSWRAVTTSRSMGGASSARRNAGPGPSSGSSHTDVWVSHHNPHRSYIIKLIHEKMVTIYLFAFLLPSLYSGPAFFLQQNYPKWCEIFFNCQ